MKTAIRKAIESLCLPQLWRTRPEPKPEQNDAVLARLQDTDPVFRALMDKAVGELENSLMESTKPGLTAEDRAYHSGSAGALARYVTGVMDWRENARAAVAKAMKGKG